MKRVKNVSGFRRPQDGDETDLEGGVELLGCNNPREGAQFWAVMRGEVAPPANQAARRTLHRHTKSCHVCRYRVLEQWAQEVFRGEQDKAEDAHRLHLIRHDHQHVSGTT